MQKLVLVNCSTIVKGGAIQAGVNFIISAINDDNCKIDWYFVLSHAILEELDKLNVFIVPGKFISINNTPAKSFFVRKQIKEYEKLVKPNLVFSFFGPSYINFNAFEISGFANGWVTHSNFRTFSDTYGKKYITIIKSIIKYIYYAYFIRKSNAWIFETLTSLNGFVARLKVNTNLTHVVPNSCTSFENFERLSSTMINGKQLNSADRNFLVLASDYPHKNIDNIIKAVSFLNNSQKSNFKVLLTIEEKQFRNKYLARIIAMDIQDVIVNLGHVSQVDIEKLYGVAYATLLPSYIETYSAVYPESMLSKTPIITTNALFARELCGEAALYVEPTCPKDIARKMEQIIEDKTTYNRLSNNCAEMAKSVLSQEQKYQSYIRVLSYYL